MKEFDNENTIDPIDSIDRIHEENIGEVKIADDIIAVCAVNAILRTEGVAGLSGNITEMISEKIMRKESISKGIKVNQSDEGVQIDVFVDVEYGVKIPVVAWDIQKNVKAEIESMTDRTVTAVNIHVMRVKEKKTDEEPGKE